MQHRMWANHGHFITVVAKNRDDVKDRQCFVVGVVVVVVIIIIIIILMLSCV